MGANTLVEADIWTVAQTEQGNVILVRPKHSSVAVPVFVGTLEAQSILIGLGRVEMPRPLTHDLFLSVLMGFRAVLARIEIYDLREGTFYARLVIESPQGEQVFDARPSDAMALAVRCSAGVYIAEAIVEDVGVPVDVIREAAEASEKDTKDAAAGSDAAGGQAAEVVPSGQDASPERSAERDELLKQLDLAVEREDYEKAAAIRDRLKELGF